MHVDELICAESVSQRYQFLASVAAHMPALKIVVHDDACHLRLMAEANQSVTTMAVRLGTDMAYIVDENHSSGHVGKWCSENCMSLLEANKELLNTFPTNILRDHEQRIVAARAGYASHGPVDLPALCARDGGRVEHEDSRA